MISAAEIGSIQRDVAKIALSLPCQIQRKSITKDIYGGDVESWPVISPNDLMCGMSEPTGSQLSNYDYIIASLATWQVKLPVNTDIAHQDRLIVNGETLVVQVILEPKSYQMLLTVLASELK